MDIRHRLTIFRFYGWVILLVSFLGFMVYSLSSQTITIFMKSILVEFGGSRAAAFLGISISCLVAGVSGTLAGALSDRVGSRWVISIGAILLGLALASVSMIGAIWQFYLAFGVLASFFSASVSMNTIIPVLGNWFRRYRGTAITLAFMGIGASKLFAGPLERVMEAWGWRGSFVFLGILSILLISPWAALFFVRSPEERGLKPDGFLAAPEGGEKAEAQGRARDVRSNVIATTLSEAVRTHQFWMLSIAQFITPMGAQLAFYHFGTHLQDVGYSAGQVAHIWGNLMLAAAVSTPLYGWISDKLGHLQDAAGDGRAALVRLLEWSPLMPRLLILTVAYVFTSVGILILSSIQDTESPIRLWLFILIFGGSYTIRGPMFYAITIELFEGEQQGRILGATQMFQRFGMGLAPWVGGLMFDLLGSYKQAFYLGIASLMGACLCAWTIGIGTRSHRGSNGSTNTPLRQERESSAGPTT